MALQSTLDASAALTMCFAGSKGSDGFPVTMTLKRHAPRLEDIRAKDCARHGLTVGFLVPPLASRRSLLV
ncbi:hypothetical protein Sjap_007197 [Stephania japonica]|uniref:Uncharacterized protein n=1 Tax=Stephania japonica TaxID=461633 RepID=A0AAP0JM67_9MAGN